MVAEGKPTCREKGAPLFGSGEGQLARCPLASLQYPDPLEFDGSLFRVMDGYKHEMLASADRLRTDIGACQSLGDIVTPDIIAQGRAVFQSVDVRNQNPFFPPVFLTYCQNLEWIVPTDKMLTRMRGALAKTPKRYRAFVRDASVQPVGSLFELNIYAALDDAFPGAEPQPHLPGSRKLSDIKIMLDGAPVFVEATVMDELRFWKDVRLSMHKVGQNVWAGSGPGPADGAFRVVSKVAKESVQTADAAPNIICLSFFDTFPIPPARQWAFDDLWAGGPTYGGPFPNGSRLDLSRVPNIDSIFEFSRDALLNVHVNPNAAAACRLSDAQRGRIRERYHENC
jgi:hypothetical protein